MLQRLKNIYHLLTALLAAFFYRFPVRKLKVIGVTGTDGKTTTVNLIYQILKEAGFKVSAISTLGALIGEEELDTGFHVTTPDPWQVQKYLRMMVDAGSEYAVLEVTSHALDQNRVFGVHFLVGVLTNITPEHLDYHKTFENYLAAKAKLFKGVKFSVLNLDDESFEQIAKLVSGKIVTYGIKEKADVVAKDIKFTKNGVGFLCYCINTTSLQIKSLLVGEYNVYNLLAAVATVKTLGVEDNVIQKTVLNFQGLSGRMEKIDEGQDFTVVVDFAHTPNSLEQVLKTLSNFKPQTSNLISVFGCAGLRDRQKRPLMGEISAQLADITVLTAEDPRTEDLNKIFEEIAAGCQRAGAKEIKDIGSMYRFIEPDKHYFVRITDRREAILFAVNLAQKDDIVGVFGKGHEKSMCFGTREIPWSDQETVREAIKNKRHET